MDLGLNGKNIFISGSSSGIGYATAYEFLAEGAKVIINSRNENNLKKAADSLNEEFPGQVSYVVADLLTEKGSELCGEYLDKKIDSLDCFVANLGNGKPFTDDLLDSDELRRFYDHNVIGNTSLLNCVYPKLKASNHASVVFISSIVSCEVTAAPCGYAMAKSSVLTLSKYLSCQWANDGIRVNCVMPGNIFFDGGRWEELFNEDKKGVSKYIEQNVPLKRFGKPEEVASTIVFLASEKAGFVTGAALSVDGGQLKSI